MTTIRPAHPSDAPGIAAVHVASWQAAYTSIVPQHALDSMSPADFTTLWQGWLPLPSRHVAHVAEQNGTIIGFATGGPLREPQPPFDAELYTLYLLPAAKRTGIGRRLFSSVAIDLLDLGFHHLLLWSFRDNSSTGFYQHLGGQVLLDSTIDLAGTSLPTRAFGWRNLTPQTLHRGPAPQ